MCPRSLQHSIQSNNCCSPHSIIITYSQASKHSTSSPISSNSRARSLSSREWSSMSGSYRLREMAMTLCKSATAIDFWNSQTSFSFGLLLTYPPILMRNLFTDQPSLENWSSLNTKEISKYINFAKILNLTNFSTTSMPIGH